MANKLVDLERLSKLAKALDDRSKQAVETEKNRASAAESTIDGKITAEVSRATKAEQALEAKITTLNGADSVAGSVAKKIKDAVDPIKSNVSALQGSVEGLNGQISGINSKITSGDAKTLQDAKSYADTKIAGLVGSAPEDLNTLQELAAAIKEHNSVYEAYVGTVTSQLATKVDKVEGSRLISETEVSQFKAKAEVSQVNAAKQEAKDYADGKFAEVSGTIGGVSSKVTALEKTVGKAAGDHGAATGLVKDVEDLKTKNGQQDTAIQRAQSTADGAAGKVSAVEGKVATLESAVGKAGNGSDVAATGLFKDVADLKAKDKEIEGNVSRAQSAAEGANAAAGAAASTANAAKQQAATNLSSINQLKTTVGDSSSGLVKDNTDNKAAIAAINHSSNGILAQAKNFTTTEVGKVNTEVQGVKKTVEGHTTTIGENTAAISSEVSRAKAAEQAIDAKVTKLNGNNSVVGSVDNKIQTALAGYSNTENVKSLLNAVVNTLAFNVTSASEGATVTLDLSLGGAQSIAKKTINIPMATNADIDEIIAGLDAQ